jgi:hypothetical protein
MTIDRKGLLLDHVIELLEIPDSAYEKAEDRYRDIGEWLGRKESICSDYEPHIFPQGSFRLGTAIRPLNKKDEYDLDLACKLQVGIIKDTHTQHTLKEMVGNELENYRVARAIKERKEEMHRCWRLYYADDLSFHIDIVPCIPADDSRKKTVLESMRKAKESEAIADSVSQLTVSITDDRHPRYRIICEDWNISNPEGYATWFESRMRQGQQLLLERAQIDKIPIYKHKTPLQRAIQLLKRHRDLMFKDDPDLKPISIIITTLAARVFQGETDVVSTLNNVIYNMENLVNSSFPRIPNPVDPNEDFADRWTMPRYKHLNLEVNFRNWIKQVQSDFELLVSSDDVSFITEQAKQKFSVSMDSMDLRKRLGLVFPSVTVIPKTHTIIEPPKPWRME